jgi:hypothetical protein
MDNQTKLLTNQDIGITNETEETQKETLLNNATDDNDKQVANKGSCDNDPQLIHLNCKNESLIQIEDYKYITMQETEIYCQHSTNGKYFLFT